MSESNSSKDGLAIRRRRDRKTLVCLECHRRKLKCDKKLPCNRCIKRKLPHRCSYGTKNGENGANSVASGSQHGFGGGDRDSETIMVADDASRSPEGLNHRHSSAQSPEDAATVRSEARPSDPPSAVDGRADKDAAAQSAQHPRSWHGRSSVRWLFPHFDKMFTYINKAGFVQPNGEFMTFDQCKTQLFQRRTLVFADLQSPPATIGEEMPQKETADRLMDKYFDTFGQVFRIFDQPAFSAKYATYWEAPRSAPVSMSITILLMIAIGNSCVHPSEGRLPDETILKWWHLALSWEGVVLHSTECDLATLQACCLIGLMQQAYNLNGSTGWRSSAMLVRNAMTLGLHRDVTLVADLPAGGEPRLRQHLWYTILELDLQSCMDEGMPPSLSEEDWDMQLPHRSEPSALDVDLGDSSNDIAAFRNVLAETLSTRVRIAAFLNKASCSMDYGEAMDLGASLLSRVDKMALSPTLSSKGGSFLNNFALGFSLTLCQRSLFAVHLPFAILGEPRYAFSHNVCLSTALAMLERLDPGLTQDDVNRENGLIILMRTSGSLFRTTALQAVLFLCQRIQPGLDQAPPWTLVAQLGDKIQDVLRRYANLAREKVKSQNCVGKAYLIPYMTLECARLSISPDDDADACYQVAANRVAERCFSLFCRRVDIMF